MHGYGSRDRDVIAMFPDVPADADAATSREPGFVDGVNKISFTLDVETSADAVLVKNLVNRFERPESRVVAVSIHDVDYFDGGDMRPIAPDVLRRKIAFVGDTLTLHNGRDRRPLAQTFAAPNGYLTVYEMLRCIEAFEMRARPQTDWFGGVDCHHTFFEGMHRRADGAYSVSWGS